MAIKRVPRLPRRSQVVGRHRDNRGGRYTLRQKANGDYTAEYESKDGEDFNIAIGSSPKEAMQRLKAPLKSWLAADRDPVWKD